MLHTYGNVGVDYSLGTEVMLNLTWQINSYKNGNR